MPPQLADRFAEPTRSSREGLGRSIGGIAPLPPQPVVPADPQPEASLETLLAFLRDARGFDFTGYKRTTLTRRIAKRMAGAGVASYEDYIDLLEVQPQEFAELFDTVLINVTAFFRDAPAWDLLREAVIGELLGAVPSGAPIRVWCAGCASGEEPYTLAILLCEALGSAEFLDRVKIYATDVDEDALRRARAAVYPAKALDGVPAELAERYFSRVEQGFGFRKDLRRAVVFGRNDLVQDAPISRIDLLSCRNTLMYFNAETQARIVERLHFALEDHGVLLLGKSEMLSAHSGLFRPVDLRRRVFAKVPRVGRRAPRGAGTAEAGQAGGDDTARGAAFEAAPVAQMIVDGEGQIVAANGRARRTLRIDPADVGRPVQDLEVSYRPLELRAHLAWVTAERRSLTLPPTAMLTAAGERREVEVQLTPLEGLAPGAGLAVVVSFLDVTEQRRLLAEVETSRVELSDAYEELQSTVEELETTNEELQSTNEELETTNEELQSTNEELETTNEELQSINQELATVNDELRTRSLQLDDLNGFLETVLSTMGVAVAVVDRMQVVQMWNGQAEELWGLRAAEVIGHTLLALDIGLPVRDLVEPVRDAILRGHGAAEFLLEAVNRRGRTFSCKMSVLPLHARGEVTGALVLMTDAAITGLVASGAAAPA